MKKVKHFFYKQIFIYTKVNSRIKKGKERATFVNMVEVRIYLVTNLSLNVFACADFR